MNIINPTDLPCWEYANLPPQVQVFLQYGHLVGSQAYACLRGAPYEDSDWDILIRPRLWRDMLEEHHDLTHQGGKHVSSFGGLKLKYPGASGEVWLDIFPSPLEEYLRAASDCRAHCYAIDFEKEMVYHAAKHSLDANTDF